nr:GntR family transcriptional regulator [Shimia aestuarii]
METGPKAKERLSDVAYDAIKKDIITHRLPPQSKISEGRLVDSMGLSRAPIRSALARLQSEGFVYLQTSKTQLVAPLNLARCEEVFHLRNILEPDAARQAAGKVDAEELHRLNEACAKNYTAGNADEEYELLLANKEFHLAIVRASGNDLQAQFIERLQDIAMRILWVSLRVSNRSIVWSEGHLEIIEALIAGDGDRAYKEALVHLTNGQDIVNQILKHSSVLRQVNLS